MPASIGVNLRVTGHCRQGGRKYMEDFFSVAYQQTEDERDLEYAFFGIYDGHGGAEAASFAKEHLMETIIKHKNFWSDNDEDVLRAIKDGYIATHYAMWREQDKWPRTASGLPSTAGTTASVAFIRRGKIYIGHVGDSGIIMGYQDPSSPTLNWRARPLTRDHKPENLDEMTRINKCGGKVVAKSGVPRVVWNRPKVGHQGPVRRSTPIDEIPFLAVARSLGDLWSYNSQINQFIVSPDPDCSVVTIDTNVHRCLIFGTDGLFNMLSPQNAVHIVQQAELHNEEAALGEIVNKTWMNPSKLLVEKALERWNVTKMRADNTSVVTLMLDPPGPPRVQVLKNRKKELPKSGCKILQRYNNNTDDQEKDRKAPSPSPQYKLMTRSSPSGRGGNTNEHPAEVGGDTGNTSVVGGGIGGSPNNNRSSDEAGVSSTDCSTASLPLKERNLMTTSSPPPSTAITYNKPRESTSFDPRTGDPDQESFDKENAATSSSPPSSSSSLVPTEAEDGRAECEDSIQINEISSSSSNDDDDEDDLPSKHNLRSSKAKRKMEEEAAEEEGDEEEDGDGEGESMQPHTKGQVKVEGAADKVQSSSRKKKKVMSLAQKIVKSKKLAAKKAAPLKRAVKLKAQKLMAKKRKSGRLFRSGNNNNVTSEAKTSKTPPKRKQVQNTDYNRRLRRKS